MIKDSRKYKLYREIAQRRCKSTKFADVQRLLELHDWELKRISGSHHIFSHVGYMGVLSIPRHGKHVKEIYCKRALRAIEEIEGYE